MRAIGLSREGGEECAHFDAYFAEGTPHYVRIYGFRPADEVESRNNARVVDMKLSDQKKKIVMLQRHGASQQALHGFPPNYVASTTTAKQAADNSTL